MSSRLGSCNRKLNATFPCRILQALVAQPGFASCQPVPPSVAQGHRLNQESRRLRSRSGERRLSPVIFPSGRAGEATNPAARMSSADPTIGMVWVSCYRARVASSPTPTSTSGASLTIAAARAAVG